MLNFASGTEEPVSILKFKRVEWKPSLPACPCPVDISILWNKKNATQIWVHKGCTEASDWWRFPDEKYFWTIWNNDWESDSWRPGPVLLSLRAILKNWPHLLSRHPKYCILDSRVGGAFNVDFWRKKLVFWPKQGGWGGVWPNPKLLSKFSNTKLALVNG